MFDDFDDRDPSRRMVQVKEFPYHLMQQIELFSPPDSNFYPGLPAFYRQGPYKSATVEAH